MKPKRLATNVSCLGDEQFKRKLRALSAKTGKDIAVLVRESIDAHLGADLDRIDASFFSDESANSHNMSEGVLRTA